MLTQELGRRFMAIALGHVTREYPTKLDQVLTGPDDLRAPRALHPIFFGSFDWHSCVHAYWVLARLSGRFPDTPEAAQVRALFVESLTPERVAAECAYLARPFTATFERPYGWAWVLMLCAELHRQHGAAIWAANLQPLGEAFAQRFVHHLPKAAYPVRSGVHSNTAFALTLAMDYAQTCRDDALAHMLTDTARRWYLRRCGLPGLGTQRRGFPVALPHRGGVYAPRPAAGRRSLDGLAASCRGCSIGNRRRCSCRSRSATAATDGSRISTG